MIPWLGQGSRRDDPERIRQGGVVWAPIQPDAGAVKPRRCIVLSTEQQLRDPAHKVLVIGATSSPVDNANPRDYFPLPWTHDGRCATTFNKPSYAKRTFVQQFDRSRLKTTAGYLPTRNLKKLIEWLENAP